MATLDSILPQPALLGNATPQPTGTAAPGVALTASRADHVHAVGTSENLRTLIEAASKALNNNPRTRPLHPQPPTRTVGTITAPAGHTRIYTFGAAAQPFVSSGGRPTTVAGRTTFPVVTPSNTRIAFVWRVETVVDSDSVAFLLDSTPSANGYRFIVDGQYVSLTGSDSAAGSERYYRLVWPTKARRRVIVEADRLLGFWGAAVPDDGQCLLPSDGNSIRMFLVGDSDPFMDGFNQKSDSYGQVLGDFLGIRDTWIAPISATGFIVAGGGANYGGRRDDWKTLAANSVDLLVFQLSYNDYNASVSNATLQAAVALELTEARAAHPNAIVIGYGNNSWSHANNAIDGLTAHEVAAEAAFTAQNDPLMRFLPIYNIPNRTLPITGDSAVGDTGTGNTPRYVSHAANHMNRAGNLYFGEWLARRMFDLFASMAGIQAPAIAPRESFVVGDATPQPLGTAAPGTSAAASRQDHVHARRFGIEINTQNAAYTFALADRDGSVRKSDTGAYPWTIELDATLNMEIGSAIDVTNDGTAGNVTVTPASGVTLIEGTTTGAFVLLPGVSRMLHKQAANRWRLK